jgi:hypothetical protein
MAQNLEIQTPDGQQILVGAGENEVLVYDVELETWHNKAKIKSTYERGRLLLPNGDQVLVGEDETLALIYQQAGSNWILEAR